MLPGTAVPSRPGADTGAAADDLFGDLDLPQPPEAAEAAARHEQQHNPDHHPPDSSRAPLYMWSMC